MLNYKLIKKITFFPALTFGAISLILALFFPTKELGSASYAVISLIIAAVFYILHEICEYYEKYKNKKKDSK